MDFFHFHIQMIQRSTGRSAVAAAAYRSGSRFVNSWDGTKRQVQVIQPTVHAGIHQPTLAPAVKKRVAAYARVSTEHEEQQSSYEAQVDYYTRKITERSDWAFVEVYTDKGISGTNTKKREGFNRMIRDALDGKIDLITVLPSRRQLLSLGISPRQGR